MDLSEALHHIKRGDAVLFTGAGFSFGAENANGDLCYAVPDAASFSRYLGNMLGEVDSLPLPLISKSFIRRRGANELIQLLSLNFLIVNVKKYHETIATLPWMRVYSTNYDNCFEFSAQRSRSAKKWISVTLESEPAGLSTPYVVHINGFVSNLNHHTIENQVKLTHSSYAADGFADSKWSRQFRQDIAVARAIVFVGYSMADLDVERLIYADPGLKDRTFFIVKPNEARTNVEALSDYGEVLDIGIEKFASLIESAPAPAADSNYTYTWLQPFRTPPTVLPHDDRASFNLITTGQISVSEIIIDDASSPLYCVRRTATDDIVRQISNGRRWFLIHANLGNGKTLLKFQLSLRLDKMGYSVFWDSDFAAYRERDLRAISKERPKIAIILDEQPDRFDSIKGLRTVDNPNVVVVVCVRSTLFELGEEAYEYALPGDFYPVDLNKLDASEIMQAIKLFDKLGFWQGQAALSQDEKFSYIRSRCSSEISRLILSLFESSEIGNKLRLAFNSVTATRTDLARVVIASMLVSRLEHTPSPQLLSELLNIDAWNIIKRAPTPDFGEFVKVSGGSLSLRSSIVSSFILKHGVKGEILIQHVEAIVRSLSKIKRTPVLHHIFTELQRFPVLESIIQGPNKRAIIVGYYQSIKELAFCQRNALFWLHYAMARLTFGEFAIADLYFGQARDFARGDFGLTRDVNNHYARLLLDSRLKGDGYSDYFEAFERAHSILIEQMNRHTNRHYPYRQAKKYVEFISYRKAKFTPHQIGQFVSACRQVRAAIQNLTTRHIANEISECDAAMERAIKLAQS